MMIGRQALGRAPLQGMRTARAPLRLVAQAKGKASSSAPAAKGFGTKPPPSKQNTCSCGSNVVYKDCCEPFHAKKAVPDSAELLLRARFSAIVKGDVDYLVATDRRPKTLEAPDQLKRDMEYTVKTFKYSGLKIVEQEAAGDAATAIKFTYKSVKSPKDSMRFGMRVKAEEVEKNVDGSPKLYTTTEKSRFEKGSDGAWVLADSEVLSHE
ncbi:hypothetical protein FOA52_014335 [Chlamydomonas sp. UWO 241]|nr:hypothetical protein FOA52_014335 [Chlamydomonas sp. UWO 241]